MEKLKRRIFFWTLVALFFIVAPSIIMNARGYRFDFSRGVFVHSGSIMLKTNPQDFNSYVNGKLETSKKINRINSSYTLTGFIPGSYEISLGADGFQTWTKKTDVHSGLASEFWNILLVRKDYARTTLETQGLDNFFISPTDKNIALVKNTDAGVEMKILNIAGKTIDNSFSFPGSVFDDKTREENIEWSPNEDYLSVPVKLSVPAPTIKENPLSKIKTAALPADNQTIEKYHYFIANPSNDSSFNLNSFLEKEDIQNVRWDPRDKNYLFFLSENRLYRANITNKNDLKLIADNVSAFDLSKNSVYYTQTPNELVFKTSLDGTASTAQLTNNFPDTPVSPTKKLVIYDDDRIAFLNSNHEFFIYNKGEHDTYFRKLGDNIQSFQFSDDGKKLLFASDNEIFTYFLRDWSVQPERAENEIQSVTRYSENLKNIQWFKDYEHIIFSAGSYVKIIELDSRDHRNCMDILKTGGGEPKLTYNHSSERLFFIDQNGDASDLYNIIFPEPGAFLGIFPPAQQ
ncbi:MAG: hypothetical protein WC608_00885 [Parcubacteria group bacterium]